MPEPVPICVSSAPLAFLHLDRINTSDHLYERQSLIRRLQGLVPQAKIEVTCMDPAGRYFVALICGYGSDEQVEAIHHRIVDSGSFAMYRCMSSAAQRPDDATDEFVLSIVLESRPPVIPLGVLHA